MAAALLAAALVGLSGPGLAAQMTPGAALTPRDSARHALLRLAFGPTPGEVDSVARTGVMRWIDAQLDPVRLPDPALDSLERRFAILRESRADLLALRRDARDARDRARIRPLLAEAPALAVLRAERSNRQLYEVMVDFWTNHFNVFAGKGLDGALLPDWIERTIRPHAMGRFEDLLVATAEDPAMLFYLDNWESVAPGATPPRLARLESGVARRRARGLPVNDSALQRVMERMPSGINENYGRELLELHTLGVDGGYTQADVIAAARILTGWGIDRPQQDAAFAFHDWAHDRGAKTILGVDFPAGHGMDEGLRLLRLLANAPATMRHVSEELCRRFVADDPPDGCVDDAVAAWKRSGGDITEVLRAIFHGPDFWTRENVGSKIKSPLEFVVSAARALGADADTSPRLAQLTARLGEPLYRHVAPDGYPERSDAWVNSGALLDRMNAALALAGGKLPGVTVQLDAVAIAGADHAALVDSIDARLFGGGLSAHTRQVILDQLGDLRDPDRARTFALGLALGGPEFQKQ